MTGVILALSLPGPAPWYVGFIASFVAIGIGKTIFGGVGMNLFNPAMVARVALLISFPLEMTMWTAPFGIEHGNMTGWPDFTTTFNWVFLGTLPFGQTIDSISMATPIDLIKTQLSQFHDIAETRADPRFAPLFDTASGTGWQWINLAYLIGGLALLKLRVIQWHIPVSLLGSLFLIALVFYLLNPDHYTPPDFQLFTRSPASSLISSRSLRVCFKKSF